MTARRSEQVYALLLRAYPAEFRAAYGREMTLCFRDLRREAGSPGLAFWLQIVNDVARTAPALRVETLRAQLTPSFRMEEGRMKPMGILAVLIGLLQAANAIVELTAGGAGRSALPTFTVLLAIVVGLLLVAAGVALVRRAPRAVALARIAAVSWLALVVIIRAVHPWMSIFASLLAVAFPIALLAYVWVARETPRAA